MRRAGRAIVFVSVGAAVIAATALPASAHPMGNFTVNTAAAAVVAPEGVRIDYAVDMAEIPTLQAQPSIDADRDGVLTDDETNGYVSAQCVRIAGAVDVTIDGSAVQLAGTAGRFDIMAGSAGLTTLRFECSLAGAAPTSGDNHTVAIADRSTDRIGWHEISARGDGVRLTASDVPEYSPSAMLTRYPTDVRSPLDVHTAALRFAVGGPRLAPVDDHGSSRTTGIPGVDGATRRFGDLVSARNLTVKVGVAAALIAFVLGAMHALAPGHGKTVMAAYLVGQKGTLRQALGIGAGVTLTHTAGVLVLGLLLSTSTAVAPEDIYPVLAALSGALVTAIGLGLFRRARRLRRAGLPGLWHGHDHLGHHHGTATHHGHDHHDHEHHGHEHHDHEHHDHEHHDHEHHGHEHHDHEHHDATGPARLGWRWVFAMGFAGGLVPSPSALVVLLGAIALGRTWFGVGLVVAYGAGMAATLLAAGLVLVRARARIDRVVRTRRGQRTVRLMAGLPMLTAGIITLGGCAVMFRAFESL